MSTAPAPRRRRRILPWVLALALVLAVGLVVRHDVAPPAVTVRGVVGSETLALLRDPRLLDILREQGIDLQVDPAGSRQLATTVPLQAYDFAFPSSSPAADRLLAGRPGTVPLTPFSSPMVIATYAPIVDVLRRAGVVHGTTFDVHRYLDLVARGTRWDRLPGNTAFPARKDVLVSTTEPCESNSAAMYVSVAGYVADGDTVPATPAAAAALVPRMRPLFDRQGYLSSTSETLFDDYVSAGMGKTPMALVYEAQFLARRIQGGPLPEGAVQLDLDPTVFSRHTLVPLSDNGRRVGELLASDPRLLDLAAEYGFRPQDPGRLGAVLSAHAMAPPAPLVNVIEPPRFETLEALLGGLGCPA